MSDLCSNSPENRFEKANYILLRFFSSGVGEEPLEELSKIRGQDRLFAVDSRRQ